MEQILLTPERIKELIIEKYPCFDEEDDAHVLELEQVIAKAQLKKVAESATVYQAIGIVGLPEGTKYVIVNERKLLKWWQAILKEAGVKE